MDVWKKSVFLGLTLLAFCVLVETVDLCKFVKMFPPKKHNHLIENDTLQEVKGSNCPSGYTKQLNGSCYKFVDSSTGANRSEAQSECKSNSSHLVFIETEEENNFLVTEAGGNTEYWIGIHERPTLFWDNGNHVTFTNIDPDNSYTFNDGSGCYVMSDNDERIWLEKQCSENFTYICEYEGVDCPSGYAKTDNSSCYKFGDCGSRATRSEAQSACKRDSSHLVFIETKEENDFLIRKSECNAQYWIGIHERPNLFWDNGNQVNYANFDQYSDHNFNDGTGCYRMYKDGYRYWYDTSCTRRSRYICEHEGNECPEEYTLSHSSSCYKFADSRATLSEARSACKNDSSHLVFIETEEENDVLIREATSGKYYWIGIHERPHLFWDNGNHVTFANIDPDDTDTLSERNVCYRMRNGTKRYWSKSSCSHKHGYICEYEEVS